MAKLNHPKQKSLKQNSLASNKPQLDLPEILEVKIQGYSHKGEGVARFEKQVIFISGAILGETLQIRIIGKQKSIYRGEILKIVQPSSNRITPVCACYNACGGCSLQHLAYESQLAFKEKTVQDLLVRLGKFEAVEIEGKTQTIMGMAEPWHYRNKGIFHIKIADGKFQLGFQEEGTHKVADSHCAYLFSRQVDELLQYITLKINSANKLSGIEMKWVGVLTKLLVRESRQGQLMLVFMVREQFKQYQALWYSFFADLQVKFSTIKVVAISVDRGEINPIYENLQYYTKSTCIEEDLANVRYEISPASFFQVNSRQFEKILEIIISWIAPKNPQFILDAYCGIGTIGLYLAKNLALKKLIGIETVGSAVADAKKNAELNQLQNTKFCLGKAENLFADLTNQKAVPDLIVVDPPRKGCDPKLLSSILALEPATVVYVSCNPATLARDLAILCQAKYKIEAIQPVDLFPQSWHVECVVLMSRVQK